MAWASVLLQPGTTTVDAELTGAELVTAAARNYAAIYSMEVDAQPKQKVRRLA